MNALVMKTIWRSNCSLGGLKNYPSKSDLIDEVINNIEDFGVYNDDDIVYDEERARLLLQQTGWLDVDDFDKQFPFASSRVDIQYTCRERGNVVKGGQTSQGLLLLMCRSSLGTCIYITH